MSRSVISSETTAQALARLREQGPAAGGVVDIPCRCTVTGGDYVISFSRASAKHRYQVRAVRKVEPAPRQGALARLRATLDPPRQRSMPIGDFDFSGADECPWCCWNRRPQRIGCDGCGLLVCGGRSRPAPGQAQGWLFTCTDGCGAGGFVCTPMTAVNGQDGGGQRAGATLRLSSPGRAALAGNPALRLGRPAR